MKDNTIYVLSTEFGVTRGVYSSKKNLSAGVDYWIKVNPDESLRYKPFMLNYIPGDLDKNCTYVYFSCDTCLPPQDMINARIGVNLLKKQKS